jgi:hypothetical protein
MATIDAANLGSDVDKFAGLPVFDVRSSDRQHKLE